MSGVQGIRTSEQAAVTFRWVQIAQIANGNGKGCAPKGIGPRYRWRTVIRRRTKDQKGAWRRGWRMQKMAVGLTCANATRGAATAGLYTSHPILRESVDAG